MGREKLGSEHPHYRQEKQMLQLLEIEYSLLITRLGGNQLDRVPDSYIVNLAIPFVNTGRLDGFLVSK
jgi:hypothetical protein